MKLFKKIKIVSLLLLSNVAMLSAQENQTLIQKPFPQVGKFAYYGTIPNHKSTESVNSDIIDYYEYWKKSYLKPTLLKDGYFIQGEATNNKVPSKGTSEGHGFGMIITVLMAGQDTMAKTYFDGLFLFFDTHRSILNNELMGWLIAEDERDSSFDCATDGDMDIAYALLLADKQWGSDSKIDYLGNAKRIITNGLKKSCISPTSKRVVLGDWDTLATATRSSDWMTAQMRAYSIATQDNFWMSVIDTVYSMIDQITTSYSPKTGLMPDFVTGSPAKPVDEGFLEKSSDKDFSWNASRYPWRIASDYLHYQEKRSYDASMKVATWAMNSCKHNPNKFTAVYKLDGTPIEKYTNASFTSPMILAASVSPSNQDFINDGWEYMKKQRIGYYSDNITLLCMLMASGNWWSIVPM